MIRFALKEFRFLWIFSPCIRSRRWHSFLHKLEAMAGEVTSQLPSSLAVQTSCQYHQLQLSCSTETVPLVSCTIQSSSLVMRAKPVTAYSNSQVDWSYQSLAATAEHVHLLNSSNPKHWYVRPSDRELSWSMRRFLHRYRSKCTARRWHWWFRSC